MLRFPRCSGLCMALVLIACGNGLALNVSAQESSSEKSSVKKDQSPPQKPDPKTALTVRPLNAAFAPIEEQADLPRVLLIGDSISMGYTLPVRKLLENKANVLRPAVNCGPSSRGVELLDRWLGDDKWDVIHFNFGLHDIVYYTADGKMRAEPSEAGARHQVLVDDYERNLRKIVSRLKQTGATLIWCSTTPVPEGSAGRVADESVEYNRVAAGIMHENGVTISDLHTFTLKQSADIQLPKNVHFTPQGYETLARHVAKVIEAALVAK
jgi:hypothetical protein